MRQRQPEKLGVMGGTFDPIHDGHLLIAQSAAEEFRLDQVLFLPTGKSPHKRESQVTDSRIRCEMVKIAIQDNPTFAMSVLEAQNETINYTYLTLHRLHRMYPNASIYFIMGEDSLDDFQNWRNPKEICRLSSILVAVRGGGKDGIGAKIEKAKETYGARMHMLHAPDFSISSREIRARVQMGKSIKYMVPKEVESYIKNHSLYMGWDCDDDDGKNKADSEKTEKGTG